MKWVTNSKACGQSPTMAGNEPSSRMTYGGYLRIEDLLKLQAGPDGYSPSPCNNELHFIIVHQSFELWFKLVLSELKEAYRLLSAESVDEQSMPQIVHHLDRVTTIMKLMTHQWDVMQSLAPQEFLAFRDRLGTSSGFESWQMRELEVILGLDNSQRMGGMDPLAHMEKLVGEGKVSQDVFENFEQVSSQPSLNDVLNDWLSRTPINGSVPSDAGDSEVVSQFIEGHINAIQEHGESVISHIVGIGHGEEGPVRARIEAGIDGARSFLMPNEEVDRSRAGLLFIESYRELTLLAWPRKLIDTIVELEQSMLLFRSHHARMVERMIGRRMGTGGSSGVDYLDATLKYRIFVDLWSVRTLLVKRDALPEIENSEYYGFTQS